MSEVLMICVCATLKMKAIVFTFIKKNVKIIVYTTHTMITASESMLVPTNETHTSDYVKTTKTLSATTHWKNASSATAYGMVPLASTNWTVRALQRTGQYGSCGSLGFHTSTKSVEGAVERQQKSSIDTATEPNQCGMEHPSRVAPLLSVRLFHVSVTYKPATG